MQFNSRYISWALACFFGWLLSFPFNGPVLHIIEPVSSPYLSLSAYFIIFHALGLLVLAIIAPNKLNLQKYMVISATFCLVITFFLLFLDITTWLWLESACFAAMGLMSSVFILGWSLSYTNLPSGFERMRFMALVIIKANLIYFAFNMLVLQLPDWIIFSGLILTLMGAIWSAGRIEPVPELQVPHKQELKTVGKGFLLLLCLFIFGIYLNGGLMYDNIYPSFLSFLNISQYFRAVPYILVLLVIFLWRRKPSGQFVIYTGASLLGLAFISFAALSDSMPGFFITGSLVEAAFAFIDLFLWVTLAELALFHSHPYRIFGFGLFANVSAIMAGGVIGNLLLQVEGSHFVLTGLFAAGAIFLTFLIMPWLLKRFEEGADNFNNAQIVEEGLPDMIDRIPGASSLTPRENEITLLLLQGLTNKETAASLSISENTLKTHIRNIYRKVGVTQKRELLSLALEKNNTSEEQELSS